MRKFAWLPAKVFDQEEDKQRTIWLRWYWKFLDHTKIDGWFYTSILPYKMNRKEMFKRKEQK